MYRRYKLKSDGDLVGLVKSYSNNGKIIMEKRKSNIKKNLEEYINQTGYINMSEIEKDWFPKVDCDIFLSHSHKDIELINGLVGFLHECFKVEVFVDSYIWGYCNELLKDLDEKYCKQDNGEYYDYDKRNYSTSHVHMMLANSLNKMIYKTECIIFLDTENSLDVKNIITNGTSSPWIYSELIATKLMQRENPRRIEKRALIENNIEMAEKFKPMYRGDVDHLEELTVQCLRDILNKKLSTKEENLDEMYKITSGEKIGV
ncbi:MAG: hypothetical protein ACRC28_01395 [Clostridium sp.]|uniref:hypothetical protein n=1 Tax=Clostridium sp. TaxID=1506 RepID=UPI003F2E6D8E